MSDPKPAAGTYLAKLDAYGVKKTSKGDPAPTIRFSVKDDKGASHPVYWQGSFNGGGRDITVKALLVCGLKDPRSLPRLAEGIKGNVLDHTKAVEIVIEHQDYTDKNGETKKSARVAWINQPGAGGNFQNAIDSKDASALFQGLGLEADFLRIAQESGIQLGGARTALPATTGGDPGAADLDSIPF